jgi:hypothetical protein
MNAPNAGAAQLGVRDLAALAHASFSATNGTVARATLGRQRGGFSISADAASVNLSCAASAGVGSNSGTIGNAGNVKFRSARLAASGSMSRAFALATSAAIRADAAASKCFA